MLKWFRKKTITRESLRRKTTKTLKSEWEKRLKDLVKQSQLLADKGISQLNIPQAHINLEYNRSRSREDILQDIKKTFSDCTMTITADINGQEIVTVSW